MPGKLVRDKIPEIIEVTGKKPKIRILSDEEYLLETNERWTMYETYKAGDSIPEGFEVGDYKLENLSFQTYFEGKRMKDYIFFLEEKCKYEYI